MKVNNLINYETTIFLKKQRCEIQIIDSYFTRPPLPRRKQGLGMGTAKRWWNVLFENKHN